MKKTLILSLILLLLGCSISSFAQNEKADKYWEMIKTYHYTHDDKICKKTVDFLNAGVHDDYIFELRFLAFYVPLFEKDETVKAEFEKRIPKIISSEKQGLFEDMLNMTSERVYETAYTTPDVNEMLCYSYYATGDTKYIDQLLENAKDTEERVDLAKYMIGANALWWLAEIKAEDDFFKEYLESKVGNQYAETALKSRSYDLKNIQLEVLTEQKKKGIWK